MLSWPLVMVAGLLLWANESDAAVYQFIGVSNGGTGSATMDISTVGNTVTITLNNTSPELYNTNQLNAPAITAFGIDLSNNPLPTLSSWTLTAFQEEPDNAQATSGPVVVGQNGNASLPWQLVASDAGVTLDFLPSVSGIDGGLYNPLVVDSLADSAGNRKFYTTAVLTLNFASAPVVHIHDLFPFNSPSTIVPGNVDPSPYVRFQQVGDGGSLKLGAFEAPGATPVPEPTSLAIWALGVVAAGFGARRMRKQK
jgi:hypothetical protein